MQFNNKREVYRSAVIDWANRNQYVLDEHIIDIIISVLFTRDSVLIGGSFAQSICNNDLFGAFRYADKEVKANLQYIISAYHNISIVEYLINYQNYDMAQNFIKNKLTELPII
jgi:hypothetical protein